LRKLFSYDMVNFGWLANPSGRKDFSKSLNRDFESHWECWRLQALETRMEPWETTNNGEALRQGDEICSQLYLAGLAGTRRQYDHLTACNTTQLHLIRSCSWCK